MMQEPRCKNQESRCKNQKWFTIKQFLNQTTDKYVQFLVLRSKKLVSSQTLQFYPLYSAGNQYHHIR